MNELKFPAEVQAALNFYVYRLIDPRDGSTFYVGKGRGNRVFEHMQAALAFEGDEDEQSAKFKTIWQIKNSGLEPIHVIHRHGLTEDEAFAVEAALIDATPGLTNEIGGRYSAEFGPAHASQLIARYQLETMDVDPTHNLMLININQTIAERSVYDAVRQAWIVSKERAEKADYILAVSRGVCKDVFVATRWLPALKENFPILIEDAPKRLGFEGSVAPQSVRDRYRNKRLPQSMLPKKGSRSPVRYFFGRDVSA